MSEKIYQAGLPTSAHDKMDVHDYFKLVYQAVCRHRGGLIVDAFSGGGRDIAEFRRMLGDSSAYVAIDADRARVDDMLAKGDEFVEIVTSRNIFKTFQLSKILVIHGAFPDKPYGKTSINLTGCADFVLCNAGIMFVPPTEIGATLTTLSNMLAPRAEMFVRYSLARPDKLGDPTYFIHEPQFVQESLQSCGLEVTRNPDIPDPTGRPFSWVDLHCYKLG